MFQRYTEKDARAPGFTRYFSSLKASVYCKIRGGGGGTFLLFHIFYPPQEGQEGIIHRYMETNAPLHRKAFQDSASSHWTCNFERGKFAEASQSQVMSTAGANIETCGGTFVQMQNVGDAEADEAVRARHMLVFRMAARPCQTTGHVS